MYDGLSALERRCEIETAPKRLTLMIIDLNNKTRSHEKARKLAESVRSGLYQALDDPWGRYRA